MPPNHWPSPPFFQHLFLESPWALVFSLTVVAITLHLIGAQRNQKHVQRLAYLLALLAIAAPILAYSVKTDREAILNRTYQFINAAKSPQDTQTMLDTISNFATYDRYYDADRLRKLIKNTPRLLKIDSCRVTNTLARIDNPNFGSTYAAGIGKASIFGFTTPFKTQFILKWRKDDDQQWRITQIVEFNINDKPALRQLYKIR